MKKNNLFIAVIIAAFFCRVGVAYSQQVSEEESRNIVNEYFGNIELIKTGALPDIEELKSLAKDGINFNYQPERGSPSTLYRLHNLGHVGLNQTKERNEEFMVRALTILLDGGLTVGDTCNENIYSIIVTGMSTYLDALMKAGCDLVKMKINIGSGNSPRMIDPIDLADKFGRDDLVEVFIKYGATVESEETRAQLRLVGGAMTLNQSQILKALNDGAKINGSDMFDEYALIELLKSSDLVSQEGLEILKLLIKLGAKPRLNFGGDYALNVVVDDLSYYCKTIGCDGFDKPIIQTLIDAGALISAKAGLFERTPLHIAAERDYYDGASILVENGAKVMIVDATGKTPLDLARSGKIIKLLKEHGAFERGY